MGRQEDGVMSLYLAIRLMHLIALGWGLGGSTASAILMKKAEKDPSLTGSVASFHKSLSKLTWAGIILLVISGILLTATPGISPEPILLGAKHLLVVIIIFDGIYFTLMGMPQMKRLAPAKGKPASKEYRKAYSHMKKFGMLSMFSWYAIVVLSVIF